jgi:inosine/xanthosine triphosphatase
MNRWRIAVGSLRRPKLNAAKEAAAGIAALLGHGVRIDVAGYEVKSGVGHTPVSREELMQGARQRAEALQAKLRAEGTSADFYVGLEGGLDVVVENGQKRVFLESWAYMSDGERGQFGCSGSIELPEPLAEEVLHRGTELGIAMDHYAGTVGIRDSEGAWGILSGGLITRCDSFRLAVIAAFAPFYNKKIYRAASTTSGPAPLSAPAATTSRG